MPPHPLHYATVHPGQPPQPVRLVDTDRHWTVNTACTAFILTTAPLHLPTPRVGWLAVTRHITARTYPRTPEGDASLTETLALGSDAFLRPPPDTTTAEAHVARLDLGLPEIGLAWVVVHPQQLTGTA